MKYILLLVFILIGITSFSQTGKSRLMSMQSSFGNGIQYFDFYSPNDSARGFHPVIICGNGAREVNTYNSSPGSIGDYCKKGNFPWQYDQVTNSMVTFYVLTMHKPAGGVGNFEASRYKDGIDWVYKNLPNADRSQLYITGLSLSGGGVWAFLQGNNGDTTNSYLNKIAAAAPITGTQDAYDPYLYKALNASGVPVTAYETLDDKNMPTAGTTQHYQLYGGYNIGAYPIAVGNMRFIYPVTGGHSGAWLKAYDTGQAAFPILNNSTYKNNPNLYVWFLSKSRPALKPPPPIIVVTPPVVIPPVTTPPIIVTPPVIVPVRKVVQTIGIYNPDGTVLINITVYDDGSVTTSKT